MRIAVGISGASGTVYGQRLVQRLVEANVEVSDPDGSRS